MKWQTQFWNNGTMADLYLHFGWFQITAALSRLFTHLVIGIFNLLLCCPCVHCSSITPSSVAKCQIQISPSQTAGKKKALGQQWFSKTKVKTWSPCAHHKPLVHAPTHLILNSFYFNSMFLRICCQLHHQNVWVPVSSLGEWLITPQQRADTATEPYI